MVTAFWLVCEGALISRVTRYIEGPCNLKTLSERSSSQSISAMLAGTSFETSALGPQPCKDDEGEQTLGSFAKALAAMADSDISSSINSHFPSSFPISCH